MSNAIIHIQMNNKSDLIEIMDILAVTYPDRRPLLVYANAFQLLMSVPLSAQTTDAAVNKVTPELFRRWPDAAALAAANPNDVQEVIHSLGFFRQKAKNLVAAAQILAEQYNGTVPESLAALTCLPGIGRKSANVIRAHLWGYPGIIVDTHFGRVCRRLNLTAQNDPVKVETEISAIVPEERQVEFSMTANLHGRRYCHSRKPLCLECPLKNICPGIAE